MNGKGTKRKNQVTHNHNAAKVLSEEEMARRIAAIEANLNASTWKTLETGGEFKKNEKLDFISDHVLIVGCDVGSWDGYTWTGRLGGDHVLNTVVAWKDFPLPYRGGTND